MKFKSLLAMALLAVGVNAFAQKDITSTYITNADLATDNSGWTAVTFNNPAKQANSGTAVEAYAGWGSLDVTEYSLLQKITLPAGSYRLQGSAFFRQGGGAKDNVAKSLGFMKAGDKSVALKTLGSETAKAYANSQTEAAGVLSAGMYVNTIDFELAAETEIEVGYYGTFDEMRSWCLVSGLKLYDMAQDPTNFDYTSHVANPSFENGTAGWTIEGEWGEQSNGEAVKVGTRYVEKWQASGGLPDGKVSQVVTGLPNGKYIVTAVANQTGENTYVIANDAKVQAPNGAAVVTLNTEVTDGTLTLAFSREATTSNWVAVDNFRIYCAELNIDELKKMHADAIADANSFLTGLIGVPYSNIEIINAVNDAIDAAELSATPSVSEITKKVDGLKVALEQAKADLETARQAYVKANPQPGDDLTFAIVNPGIDGNANGWETFMPFGGGGPMKPSNDALEFWAGSADPRAEAFFDYSQRITGLAAGVYTLKAKMFNSLNGEEGAVFNASCGLYAIPGLSKEYKTLVDVDSDVLKEYAVENIVVEGSVLEIGVKSFGTMGARWFVADDFQLIYTGPIKPAAMTFEVAPVEGENGVVTVTPSGDNKYAVVGYNMQLLGVLERQGLVTETASEEEIFDALLMATFPDAQQGTITWDIDEDYYSFIGVNAEGTNRVLVAEVAKNEDGDYERVSEAVTAITLNVEGVQLEAFEGTVTPGAVDFTVTPAGETTYNVAIIDKQTYDMYVGYGATPEQFVPSMFDYSPKSGTQTFTYADLDGVYEAGEYYICVASCTYDAEEWEYTLTSSVLAVPVTLDEVATGIKTVNTVANKNVMFNLNGQRVNNAKGIVIMNGKKVVK